MTTLTEMQMERRSRGGCEKFECTLAFWRLMLDLGKTFGWKPHGAMYVVVSMKRPGELGTLRHCYEPGALRDSKRLDADDASAWANALNVARASSHLNNMTAARSGEDRSTPLAEARHRKNDALLLSTMEEFIRYVRKGEFTFSICETVRAAVSSIR